MSATNIPDSIHQRLLNKAKAENRTFNELLVYYGIEGFLRRLGKSRHKGQLILKGAMAFQAWGPPISRTTRDIDFLGYGNSSTNNLIYVIGEICEIQIQEDGLAFQKDSMQTATIREGAQYQGTRLTFTGFLGRAKIPMAIDIGFGDSLAEKPKTMALKPILAGMEPVKILVYPIEAIFAEKLHAITALGNFNSRMKDYFDLWWIITKLNPDKKRMMTAIKTTFEQRKTDMPSAEIPGLSSGFSENRQSMWRNFTKRNQFESAPEELEDITRVIRDYIHQLY